MPGAGGLSVEPGITVTAPDIENYANSFGFFQQSYNLIIINGCIYLGGWRGWFHVFDTFMPGTRLVR